MKTTLAVIALTLGLGGAYWWASSPIPPERVATLNMSACVTSHVTYDWKINKPLTWTSLLDAKLACRVEDDRRQRLNDDASISRAQVDWLHNHLLNKTTSGEK